MKEGMTKKPCPGCGADCRFNYRPANGVCDECRLVLEHAKRAREELSKRGTVKAYRVPGRHYDLKWLPHQPHQPIGQIADGELLPRLYALMIAGSEPDDSAESASMWNKKADQLAAYRENTHGLSSECRVMRPEFAQAFVEVLNHTAIALRHAYNEGVTYGSNVLRSLQAGEITTNEFELRTGRKDG